MPVLGQDSVERLYLPTTKDLTNEADRAWVDIKKDLNAGNILDAEVAENDTERGLLMLTQLVVAWNYVAADGTALEINIENLRKLAKDDFYFLVNYVFEATKTADTPAEIKKNETLSPTSEQ